MQSVWRRHGLVIAAWLVLVVYAFPGYMNWDSSDQVFQARHAAVEDWHPPVMAAYWHVLEMLARGPLLMLLLQTSLFVWGVHAAYRLRLSEKAASIATCVTVLFPPVLTPMAVVWKDAQMAGFLLAGTMLALRERRLHRVLGIGLLLLGIAVRDNAPTALPPLMLLIISSRRIVQRRVAVVAIAAALALAMVVLAITANHVETDKRMYPWYRTVALHDIAGTICNAGPMTDAEVRAFLDGIPTYPDHDLQAAICHQYTPRVWFGLSFGTGSVFRSEPTADERAARQTVWWRAVREHTGAFLAHRWAVMKELLGLTPNDPWEPVCQTFNANHQQAARLHHDATLSWFQKRLGQLFGWLSKTILYRPWAYALGSLLLVCAALWRRDGWLVALLGSGLFYEASYFVGAAAPDFRYSHWMITCCVIALVTVFVERATRDKTGRAKRCGC